VAANEFCLFKYDIIEDEWIKETLFILPSGTLNLDEFLRKDDNLAGLENKQKSRVNLDVPSNAEVVHIAEDIYTEIANVRGTLQAADQVMTDSLANEAQHRQDVDAHLQEQIDQLGTGGGGGTVTWDNIAEKPETFPPSAHEHSAEDVGAIPMPEGGTSGQVLTKNATGQEWSNPTGGSGGSVEWDSVLNKPSSFTPSAHNHTAEDVGAIPMPAGGSAGQVLTRNASGESWKGIPRQNSYTFIENPGDGTLFDTVFRNAVANASAGDVLDLTAWTGNQSLSDTITINKALTLLLGNINISYNSTARNKNMFDITSDSVRIIGYGRSPNPSTLTAPTKLTMTGAGGGYHIRTRGASSLVFKDFDCHGIRSAWNQHEGTFTGVGGLFLEKADPNSTASGNTVNNLIIDGVFVNNTIGHGIYVDTPIIAKISNSRVSGAGRHGIYIKGGTSIVIDASYVASAHLAGFCFDTVSYAAFSASASENCGVGYWFRSCNAVNLYGCGAEMLINKGSGDTIFGSGVNNSGILNGAGSVIDDCNSTYRDSFRGVGYLITGGRNINLFAPYSTNVGMIGEAGASSVNSAHFTIKGAARGINILLPRTQRASGLGAEQTSPNRFDIRLETADGEQPRDVVLAYNPESDGTVTPTSGKPYVAYTNASGEDCPIYDGAINTKIYFGGTQYNPAYFVGNVKSKIATITCAASNAWDGLKGNIFELTLTQSPTVLANPTNLQRGSTYQIIISQDGTGWRSMTFGTAYLFPNGTVPVLSQNPNAIDILTGISDGTYLYVTMVQNFLAGI
jgi:hypothetical protein